MRNTPSARAVSRRAGKSLRPLHCRAGRFLRIPNCERPAAFFLCFFGMRRAVFCINFHKNTHMGRKSASTAALYPHQEDFCAQRRSEPLHQSRLPCAHRVRWSALLGSPVLTEANSAVCGGAASVLKRCSRCSK